MKLARLPNTLQAVCTVDLRSAPVLIDTSVECPLTLQLPRQFAIHRTMSQAAFAPLAPVQLSRAAPRLRPARGGALRARARA